MTLMAAVVFPESPIADDTAWLREQERRAIMAKHWRPGWLSGFERDPETGVPVRMWFRECSKDCPCGQGTR